MGTYRAVKVIYRRNFSDQRPYEREFRGLKDFEPISRSHDGFVDILDTGLDEAQGCFYYVMEVADDVVSGNKIAPESYKPRTLDQEKAKSGCVPVQTCVSLGVSLSAALAYLHQHGLLHRDIKPTNIIFVNGIPKIADIGLVTKVEATMTGSGTTGYFPSEGPGTVQADLYALGKVLYELSTGQDRCEYPVLPSDLDELQDPEQFRELNQVMLKACEDDPHKRYRKAEDMHADLVLLLAGKSVRRIRVLEKRLKRVTQISLASALILLIGGVGLYGWNRQQLRQQKKEQIHLDRIHGNTLADEGDFLSALPFYCESLRLEQALSLSEKNERLRIGSLLEQCPKMTQLLVLDGQQPESADLSPNGRYVITASRDGAATLCDLSEGTKRPLWHTDENKELYSASFSPEGQFVAVGGEGFVKVWETATDKLVCSVTPTGYVDSIKFTADGSKFVVASGNDSGGHIYVYETMQPSRETELTNGPAVYRWAALSRDGRCLVTAGENKTAQMWNFETMQPIGSPIKHSSWVVCAEFNSDGTVVATAASDGTVKVSDAETGRLLYSLPHPAGVRRVEFSPDDRYILTACWDHTARIWHAKTGEPVYPTLTQSGKYLVCAQFTSDGHGVLTVNANGVICLWDLATSVRKTPGRGYVLASPDGHRLFAVESNCVEVLQPANTTPLANLVAKGIGEIATSQSGKRLVTLSPTSESSDVNTFAQLWDTDNGGVISGFSLKGPVTKAFLDCDGKHMVSWETNGKHAIVSDTISGYSVRLLNHANALSDNGGCFSPDGKWLATISTTNVYVWKVDDTNTDPSFILGHPDDVEHVAFSPDNRFLVTCCGSAASLAERDAQIWDLTGQKVGPPLHHGDGVTYAEFSHDSKYLITTSEDATACVWEIRYGKALFRLQHHPGTTVSEAHFSLDDRWIVTASLNKTARVWDAQIGEPLTPQLRHEWPFIHAQFVNDDQEVFTRRSRENGGQTMIWELPIDKRSPEELAELVTVLSGYRADKSGAITLQTPEELLNAWEKFKSEHRSDFTVSADDIVNWHLLEAQACESEAKDPENEVGAFESAKQWKAAEFHWNRLVQAKPDDRNFQEHLKHARELSRKKTSLQGP
jgi:WD40 repeat protein